MVVMRAVVEKELMNGGTSDTRSMPRFSLTSGYDARHVMIPGSSNQARGRPLSMKYENRYKKVNIFQRPKEQSTGKPAYLSEDSWILRRFADSDIIGRWSAT